MLQLLQIENVPVPKKPELNPNEKPAETEKTYFFLIIDPERKIEVLEACNDGKNEEDK